MTKTCEPYRDESAVGGVRTLLEIALSAFGKVGRYSWCAARCARRDVTAVHPQPAHSSSVGCTALQPDKVLPFDSVQDKRPSLSQPIECPVNFCPGNLALVSG